MKRVFKRSLLSSAIALASLQAFASVDDLLVTKMEISGNFGTSMQLAKEMIIPAKTGTIIFSDGEMLSTKLQKKDKKHLEKAVRQGEASFCKLTVTKSIDPRRLQASDHLYRFSAVTKENCSDADCKCGRYGVFGTDLTFSPKTSKFFTKLSCVTKHKLTVGELKSILGDHFKINIFERPLVEISESDDDKPTSDSPECDSPNNDEEELSSSSSDESDEGTEGEIEAE